MSRILYTLAANYDRKLLEISKIGLENSWIFFLSKEWETCTVVVRYDVVHLLAIGCLLQIADIPVIASFQVTTTCHPHWLSCQIFPDMLRLISRVGVSSL